MEEHIITINTDILSNATLQAIYEHASAVRGWLSQTEAHEEVAAMDDAMDACRRATSRDIHNDMELYLTICSKHTLMLLSRDMMNAYALIETGLKQHNDRLRYESEVARWEVQMGQVNNAIKNVRYIY